MLKNNLLPAVSYSKFQMLTRGKKNYAFEFFRILTTGDLFRIILTNTKHFKTIKTLII